MPECVKHSTVFLYADDAELLKPMTCLLDCLLFQQDLDTVADWCSTWAAHSQHIQMFVHTLWTC